MSTNLIQELPIKKGLSMWFDSADISSLKLNDKLVTQWNDKSGNNYNLTNGNNTSPIYTTNGFNNNYPGIIFNGSSSLLTTAVISPTPVLSKNGTDTTIFVVLNKTDDSSDTGIFGLGLENNTFILRDQVLDIGANGSGHININSNKVGNIIYSLIRKGNNINMYSDGNQIGNNENASETIGTTSQTFSIGGGIADGVLFNSIISEVIIYNIALTDRERQNIEGYLACKWNLQNNFSSSHKFIKPIKLDFEVSPDRFCDRFSDEFSDESNDECVKLKPIIFSEAKTDTIVYINSNMIYVYALISSITIILVIYNNSTSLIKEEVKNNSWFNIF
jgi:hypothetical protein